VTPWWWPGEAETCRRVGLIKKWIVHVLVWLLMSSNTYLLLFQCKDGFVHARQSYVTRTLTVLLSSLLAVHMGKAPRPRLPAPVDVPLTTNAASVPRHRLSVAGLSPRKHEFNTTPLHEVDKMALWQRFLRGNRVSPPPPTFSFHQYSIPIFRSATLHSLTNWQHR
jgi:hypothetical protein